MSSTLAARRPRGDASPVQPVTDPDVLASFLEDAAHFPGGYTTAMVAPASEAGVAAVLATHRAVLPIGAQSSVTGGATPMGELLLSTARMNRIVEIGRDSVRVQPGVTLAELDAALLSAGRYYPPAATYSGAFVGGTVATNAAGAATFKYGTTRDWVQAITVVLPTGDVLDVERGATRANGCFDLSLAAGTVRVPVPTYAMPAVPKLSAGYFARQGMDLIDLFIGSEGTLGVITDITLRVISVRPSVCLVFVPFAARAAALQFVAHLRTAAQATWRTGDPSGLDISAIEHMDARCLALLHEDGVDRECGVTWPDGAAMALLLTLELAPDMTADRAFDEIGRARDPRGPDTPLVRLCRALDAAGVLDDVEIAVPGDQARAAQLTAVREAVPASVNQRVGRAKASIDARIEKTAADMIVPFHRLPELLACYDDEFARRGLDGAVWGHISDGNLHPNVIPRSFADVESGKEAILAFGRQVVRMGGSPLAEHGVGRNPVKQQLLREMYGDAAIDQMRRVKRALDPEWRLAPGVLFPPD